MPRDNVEVVRRIWEIYEAGFGRGDSWGLSAPFEEGLVAPDSTATPLSDIPDLERVYVGLEGFTAFYSAWARNWRDFSMHLKEVVDLGDNRVLAIVHQSATGKASGAPVELDYGTIYTLEDGQVVDRKDYWVEDARRAAGLTP